MALDTITGVEEYLKSGRAYTDGTEASQNGLNRVERISGGITNYVYKLTFNRDRKRHFLGCTEVPESAILKYAAEYTASEPLIRFPVERQWFEAEALKTIPSVLYTPDEDPMIRIPQVLMYDQPNAVLILEDIALQSQVDHADLSYIKHLTLQNWLSGVFSGHTPLATAINISQQIGTALGLWLARLHGLTLSKKSGPVSEVLNHMQARFGKNIHALDLTLKYTCEDVFIQLHKLGVTLSSATRSSLEEIYDVLTQDARLANQSIIMGDFWSGNVMISLEATDDGDTFKKAHVIDWEFVMTAPSYFDLAHFVAEVWMDDRVSPNAIRSDPSPRLTLLSSMFSSYQSFGLIIDLQKVIYYISGHVCCFLAYPPRTEDVELNSKVAREVLSMAIHAKAENWELLKHDRIIADLIKTLGA